MIAFVGFEISEKMTLPGGLQYKLGEQYCGDAPDDYTCQLAGYHLVVNDTPLPLGGTLDVGGYRVIDGGAFRNLDGGGCDAGNKILIGAVPAP